MVNDGERLWSMMLKLVIMIRDGQWSWGSMIVDGLLMANSDG